MPGGLVKSFSQNIPQLTDNTQGFGQRTNIGKAYVKGFEDADIKSGVMTELGSSNELLYNIADSQSDTSALINAVASRGLSVIPKFIGGWTNLVESPAVWSGLTEGYDNTVTGAMDNLDEYLKEVFPVYGTKDYLEGDIYDRLGTAKFWMEGGLDGAAFIVSSVFGGGLVAKALGGTRLATGAGKLMNTMFKASRLIDPVEDVARLGQFGLGTLMSSANEALVEGKETFKTSFEELQKQINPKTGNLFTKEEAQDLAAKRAATVSSMNMALLMFTNGMEYRMFVDDPFVAGKAFRQAVLQGKEKAPSYLRTAGGDFLKGMGSEGLVEELAQTAFQQDVKSDKSAIELYASGIIDIAKFLSFNGEDFDEDQKERVESALMGAVLGGLGGGAKSVRDTYRLRDQFNAMSKLRTEELSRLKTDSAAWFPLLNKYVNNGQLDIESVQKMAQSRFEREDIMRQFTQAVEDNDVHTIAYLTNLSAALRLYDYMGSPVFASSEDAYKAYLESNNNFQLTPEEEKALGENAKVVKSNLEQMSERANWFKQEFDKLDQTLNIKEDEKGISDIAKRLYFQNLTVIKASMDTKQFNELAEIHRQENEKLKDRNYRQSLYANTLATINENYDNLSEEDRKKEIYKNKVRKYVFGDIVDTSIYGTIPLNDGTKVSPKRVGKAQEFMYKKANNKKAKESAKNIVESYKNDDIDYDQMVKAFGADEFKYLDDEDWSIIENEIKDIHLEDQKFEVDEQAPQRAFEEYKSKLEQDSNYAGNIIEDITDEQYDELDSMATTASPNKVSKADPTGLAEQDGKMLKKKNRAITHNPSVNSTFESAKISSNNKYKDSRDKNFIDEYIKNILKSAQSIIETAMNSQGDFNDYTSVQVALNSIEEVLNYEESLSEDGKRLLLEYKKQLEEVLKLAIENSDKREIDQVNFRKASEKIMMSFVEKYLTKEESDKLSNLEVKKPYLEVLILKYQDKIRKDVVKRNDENLKKYRELQNKNKAFLGAISLKESSDLMFRRYASLVNNVNTGSQFKDKNRKKYEGSAIQKYMDYHNDLNTLKKDIEMGIPTGLDDDTVFLQVLDIMIENRDLEFIYKYMNTFSEDSLYEFYEKIDRIAKSNNLNPTLQQIEILKNLYIIYELNRKKGNIENPAIFLKGIYGSGKTKVISVFFKALVELSNDQIMISTKYKTALDVLNKALPTKNAQLLEDIQGIDDNVKLLVIDEYTLLSEQESNQLAKFVNEINKKRIENNKPILQYILLGDPAQNNRNKSDLAAHLVSYYNSISVNQGGVLTMSYRSNISSILQAAEIYRGKYSEAKNKIVTVSEDKKYGVELASFGDPVGDIVSSIKDDGKEKIVITTKNNIGKFDAVKPFAKVLSYEEAQSLEIDNVYIYLPSEEFADINEYNAAMATAISRAKAYVMMYDSSRSFTQSTAEMSTNEEATVKERESIKKQYNDYQSAVKDAFSQNKVQEKTEIEKVEEKIEEIERQKEEEIKEHIKTMTEKSIEEQKTVKERGIKQKIAAFEKLREAKTPEEKLNAINLIERNVAEGAILTKNEQHEIQRIKDNLAADGYETPELLGKKFNPGMKVIVTSSIPDENLAEGEEIITKVLIPQINKDGKMVQTAKIEVTVGTKKEGLTRDQWLEEQKKKETKADNINAKYDAKLEALENTTITEEVKTIEERKQEEVLDTLSKIQDEAAFTGERDLTPEEKIEEDKVINEINNKYESLKNDEEVLDTNFDIIEQDETEEHDESIIDYKKEVIQEASDLTVSYPKNINLKTVSENTPVKIIAAKSGNKVMLYVTDKKYNELGVLELTPETQSIYDKAISRVNLPTLAEIKVDPYNNLDNDLVINDYVVKDSSPLSMEVSNTSVSLDIEKDLNMVSESLNIPRKELKYNVRIYTKREIEKLKKFRYQKGLDGIKLKAGFPYLVIEHKNLILPIRLITPFAKKENYRHLEEFADNMLALETIDSDFSLSSQIAKRAFREIADLYFKHGEKTAPTNKQEVIDILNKYSNKGELLYQAVEDWGRFMDLLVGVKPIKMRYDSFYKALKNDSKTTSKIKSYISEMILDNGKKVKELKESGAIIDLILEHITNSEYYGKDSMIFTRRGMIISDVNKILKKVYGFSLTDSRERLDGMYIHPNRELLFSIRQLLLNFKSEQTIGLDGKKILIEYDKELGKIISKNEDGTIRENETMSYQISFKEGLIQKTLNKFALSNNYIGSFQFTHTIKHKKIGTVKLAKMLFPTSTINAADVRNKVNEISLSYKSKMSEEEYKEFIDDINIRFKQAFPAFLTKNILIEPFKNSKYEHVGKIDVDIDLKNEDIAEWIANEFNIDTPEVQSTESYDAKELSDLFKSDGDYISSDGNSVSENFTFSEEEKTLGYKDLEPSPDFKTRVVKVHPASLVLKPKKGIKVEEKNTIDFEDQFDGLFQSLSTC